VYKHKDALIQALTIPSVEMLTALLDHGTSIQQLNINNGLYSFIHWIADRRINFSLEDVPNSLLHLCASTQVRSLNVELATVLIDRGACHS
jgi:hypothetical protein